MHEEIWRPAVIGIEREHRRDVHEHRHDEPVPRTGEAIRPALDSPRTHERIRARLAELEHELAVADVDHRTRRELEIERDVLFDRLVAADD